MTSTRLTKKLKERGVRHTKIECNWKLNLPIGFRIAPTRPVADRATQEADGEAALPPVIESKLTNSHCAGRITVLSG